MSFHTHMKLNTSINFQPYRTVKDDLEVFTDTTLRIHIMNTKQQRYRDRTRKHRVCVREARNFWEEM